MGRGPGATRPPCVPSWAGANGPQRRGKLRARGGGRKGDRRRQRRRRRALRRQGRGMPARCARRDLGSGARRLPDVAWSRKRRREGVSRRTGGRREQAIAQDNAPRGSRERRGRPHAPRRSSTRSPRAWRRSTFERRLQALVPKRDRAQRKLARRGPGLGRLVHRGPGLVCRRPLLPDLAHLGEGWGRAGRAEVL